MSGHVVHFTVKATFQPTHQTGLGSRKIHTGHANLGQSKFTGPSLYPGNELSAVENHLPIVKTSSCQDESATRKLAESLSAQKGLRQAFIELQGDLGAGKTTLVRHLLRALGVQGRVKSPTYTVVEPYELPDLNIWHFDFYRFNDPREWEDAGFRDIFASTGLKLAEWPEKAAGLLPHADLVIHLEMQPDESRLVTLTAQTELGKALLKEVQI
jgi:tRNA threonylcarbamoyladenosine biosynthesis protein TsaE